MKPGGVERTWIFRIFGALLLATPVALVLCGCGTVGGSSSGNSSAPPATVTVSVSPETATIFLGNQQQMSASVSGTTNNAVAWSVNGISGGDSATGTITAGGLFTAPSALPSADRVTITATSQADKSASGTATITIESDLQVTITPTSATVAINETQEFVAQVTGSGAPSTAVNWNLTGSACPAGCGKLTASGNTATYSAPATVPSPATVSVVAVSQADPSKSATAVVTITGGQSCSPAISISPSAASVALGAQQSFSASVCFSTNQSVTWSISGSGCSGTNCGTVSSTGTNTATYTAPDSLPPTNPVTLIATSEADSTQSATATIEVVSGVGVTVAPIAAEAAANQRTTLTPDLQGSSNRAVTWSVDGVANGDATVGQICIAGSSPCSPPSGPVAGNVEYLAPAAVPSPAGVYVVATANADSSRSATAEVTVLRHLTLSLWPARAVVAPLGTVEFAAQVTGSESTGVFWQVSCASGSCGTISAGGVYTAPSAAPNPNAITVTATSQTDSTQVATATVALSSAAAISSLAPASATAGETDSFTLLLTGMNFVPTSPGPGSEATIGGATRATNCSSATSCTVTIAPTDVASAGTLTIQVQNPGGTQSNPLPLVVVPADGPADIITLSPSQPVAGSRDITAVEPTTAGSETGPLTVLFIGLLDTSTNTCNVNESPVTLTRPASGTASFAICLGGVGLDASYTYQIAGSEAGDVTVSSPQAFAGALVELTVTVSSTAAAGPRAIVVTDPGDDRAVASGAIDLE